MPRVYFRTFRTRGVYASYPAFRRTVGDGMRNEVFPDLARMHARYVRHWKKRPEFMGEYHIDASGIEVDVIPTGDAADIWWIQNQGHDEYVIKPSRARRKIRIAARKQRLGRKYKRDTRKIGRLIRPMALRFRGAGGEIVFRHQVTVRAKMGAYWNYRVADEYRPIFQRKMENIVRRGVAAAQREGT